MSSQTAPSISIRRWDIITVSLVIHLLALALPLALLQIYDRILPSQSSGTALWLLLGVGVAIALEALLRYGRTALFAYIGARYEHEASSRIFERLLQADIVEIEHRGVARVVEGLRAVSQLRDLRSGNAAVALYEIPFVFVYLALIAYIGGWLAVIPCVLFAVALGLALLVKRSTETNLTRVEAADHARRELLWASFAGLAEVKSRAAEPGLGRLYASLNGRYMAASAQLEHCNAWVRENAALLGQLSTVLVVIFGALQVLDGHLSTGALSACTLLAGRSIAPVMAGLGYLSQLAQAQEAQRKVRDLLSLPALGAPQPQFPVTQSIKHPRIEVNFVGASEERIVIEPGELVWLDCADATNASDLLAQIAGNSQSAGLRVQIDGQPIGQYPHTEVRAAISLVPRHPAVVPGSILNNLTFFDPRFSAPARELSEALGLMPHLGRLRNGVLSEIGSLGAEPLDEGIYQRIALIRALVRKPKVLLLDYADSGLDLDGQKRLAAVLQSLRGHTTVLVASAKRPLIEACDRHIAIDRSVSHE
ncbi:ABC transporter transmembrane domain-containing protein [Pseudomonas sp. H9]|uniref:ABC transporter transmembrane domain-containing protein n=1 Tax=Pseudomonas sp. H9 TaxID=483968 RepID=UPI001057DDB7|nr:ABC transporter transmembrane domain-containing protein [Pseudomonas sp. H9]TDF83795.1 ATP-binding cassette domain-containing protein [Pseudomonas sp. H9]